MSITHFNLRALSCSINQSRLHVQCTHFLVSGHLAKVEQWSPREGGKVPFFSHLLLLLYTQFWVSTKDTSTPNKRHVLPQPYDLPFLPSLHWSDRRWWHFEFLNRLRPTIEKSSCRLYRSISAIQVAWEVYPFPTVFSTSSHTSHDKSTPS